MKSLKSIAEKKGFSLSKLEHIAQNLPSVSAIKIGKVDFYSTDDSDTIVREYLRQNGSIH